MTMTPPGWYDDGHGAMRWWDGAKWTEHVAPAQTEPAVVDQPQAPAPDAAQAPQPDSIQDFMSAMEADAAQTPGYEHAPGGYPGAAREPGTEEPHYSGGFMAATEPRKSKLWVLWVVLGVVLLGIVVAIAVVVPLLFFGLTTSGGASSDGSSVSTENANQQAAVDAVELYDHAWASGDCESYFESTTESFRLNEGAADCATFAEMVSDFNATSTGYAIAVTDIEESSGTVLVQTDETYQVPFDDEGNPTDSSEPVIDQYEYTVVDADGTWLIDSIDRR